MGLMYNCRKYYKYIWFYINKTKKNNKKMFKPTFFTRTKKKTELKTLRILQYRVKITYAI